MRFFHQRASFRDCTVANERVCSTCTYNHQNVWSSKDISLQSHVTNGFTLDDKIRFWLRDESSVQRVQFSGRKETLQGQIYHDVFNNWLCDSESTTLQRLEFTQQFIGFGLPHVSKSTSTNACGVVLGKSTSFNQFVLLLCPLTASSCEIHSGKFGLLILTCWNLPQTKNHG